MNSSDTPTARLGGTTALVPKDNLQREYTLSLACILLTLLTAALFFLADLLPVMGKAFAAGDNLRILEGVAFGIMVAFLVYGSLAHQLARIGWVQRLRDPAGDRPARHAEACSPRGSSAVTVLVPAYREGSDVVRRTLLSAALQAYPDLAVVLLIDDPAPQSGGSVDAGLHAARALPDEIAALLQAPADHMARALAALPGEKTAQAKRIIALHEEAAKLLTSWAAAWPRDDHADRFFATTVLPSFADEHRQEAGRLSGTDTGQLDEPALVASRQLLATRFAARLDSFERKGWVNLPHAPNKAMNLNAYIACLGGRFRRVERPDGVFLAQVADGESTDLVVPEADFLVTLDADSVILAGYVRRLVALMRAPGNERLAVAQTPYAAFTDAPATLERLAGATTDVQLLLHQGFTRWDATFWVGANAILRRAALVQLREDDEERGFPIQRFIQDRTVIEDTESTVDLVAKGWLLYNLPERLAFSATPADYGALIIQRRRWACGGLLALPKLLRHVFAALRERRRPVLRLLAEAAIRAHYLGSLAWIPVVVLALLFVPFSNDVALSAWLPLTAIPYFIIYARDLSIAGYRGFAELPRIYALNLLLLPVNLAGALASLRQAITGHKVPFKRTPKIAGRTAAEPALLLVVWGLVVWCGFSFVTDLWLANWMHAGFVAFNGAFLSYAAIKLVGWRNTLDDLALAFHLGRVRSRRRFGDDALIELQNSR